MKEKNDGGQAFPISGRTMGMTLRDYFAAKFFAAQVVAQPHWAKLNDSENSSDEELAERSYSAAEAMIREKLKDGA